MGLTDRLKSALLAQVREEQAPGYEHNKDNPQGLEAVEEVTQMLYKWEVEQFEAGRYNPILAVVWQQALEAVQAQINGSMPITADTVLTVENPYEKEQNNGN